MPESDRLRIAVFIDFDNIEIGVKNTLGGSFDAGVVLEALKERGEVVSKTAYSDWQRAGGYSRALTQHAIRMVQRNLTPGGDKNGADINLALDALEMAFTHPHINAFVIVGGDSDFISLVEKLKQYDKKVFIVGGRQFTSGILQRNCHEFIAYENLMGASAASGGPRRTTGRDVRVDRVPVEQAVPLVTRALKVLSEREVSPQLGLLKSTLLQLDSTFSERSYGAGSFRDFVQKLEKAGVLRVSQGRGGWLVAPADGVGGSADAGAPLEDMRAVRRRGCGRWPLRPSPLDAPGNGRPSQSPAPAVTGTAADGVRELRRVLLSGQVRRWPLYLRNVKQIIRQTSPSFDERAYGFANLVDLLRAAHKDGLVRVDRDRQGVIRVFQGSLAEPQPAADVTAPAQDEEPVTVDSPEVVEVPVLGEAAVVETQAEAAGNETEPIDVEINGNVSTEPPLARGRRRRPRVTGASQRAAAHTPQRQAAPRPPARSRRRKPSGRRLRLPARQSQDSSLSRRQRGRISSIV